MPDLQEYEVTSFQYQDKNGESFKDDNGNTWCTAAFLGVTEPVRWVVKDPTKVTVGDKVFGRITDENSKAGKPYLRFRRETKPEQTYSPDNGQQTDEYWQERNNAIKAQFAIKAAIELLKNPEATDIDEKLIKHWALAFYNMVDEITAEAQKLATEPENKPEGINMDKLPL